MPEGRQSPPPSMQSGRQLKDPPGTGQGIESIDADEKKRNNQAQLENLESNPSWPRDKIMKEKFSRTDVPPESK